MMMMMMMMMMMKFVVSVRFLVIMRMYEGQSISNASYFFSFTQIQLHSLKTTTLTLNLSLFNIISVHFHRLVHLLTRACIPARIRQRSVIEFLTAEGEMPIRIHERLKNVYGDATVDVSTVRRWARRCKEAEGQTR